MRGVEGAWGKKKCSIGNILDREKKKKWKELFSL